MKIYHVVRVNENYCYPDYHPTISRTIIDTFKKEKKAIECMDKETPSMELDTGHRHWYEVQEKQI